MFIPLIFYSQILVNYLSNYDVSQIVISFAILTIFNKQQVKKFQKIISMILYCRVCFPDQFDIWFAIFEAFVKELSIFEFSLLFTKRKNNSGRQAGLTAGQAGPEAGGKPEAVGL